jgi:hypothetical protein
MLATWSDLFVPTTADAPFHAIVCRQVLFLLDDITPGTATFERN